MAIIDSLNTEEKHVLCMNLKKAGLLLDGTYAANAMYRTGKTANQCLMKIGQDLDPETILNMAAHKDPKKVLGQIKGEIEKQRGEESKEEARRSELKASRKKAKEELPETDDEERRA